MTGTPARFVPLRLAIGLVVAAPLAWLVVTRGLAADAVARGDPAAALRFYPSSPSALAAQAAAEADKDPTSAQRDARLALARAPFAAPAARALAVSAVAQGRSADSATILGRAAALGWHDPSLQYLLVLAALDAGDMTVAAERIDALARTTRAHGALFAATDAWLTETPALRPAFVARLAERPWWRYDYFARQAGIGAERQAVRRAILLALVDTPAPPTLAEAAVVVDGALKSGDPATAHTLWRALVADPKLAGGALYDPGFAGPADRPFPFEWRALPGAFATAVTERGAGGSALHATTDGSGRAPILRQLVMLPAGGHRFAITVAPAGLGRAEGFRWAISCEHGGEIGGYRIDDEGSAKSRRIDVAFAVPPGCPVQAVTLWAEHTDGGSAAEALFDDATIDGG